MQEYKESELVFYRLEHLPWGRWTGQTTVNEKLNNFSVFIKNQILLISNFINTFRIAFFQFELMSFTGQ